MSSEAEILLKALRERGGCAKLPELAVATGYSVFRLLTVLNELLAVGAVRRDRVGDPLNPLSTTEWCVQEPKSKQEVLGSIEALIATPPLLKDAAELIAPLGIPVISSQEILRNALCNTSTYFKLAVPYIDSTAYVFFTENCLSPKAEFKILLTGQREDKMQATLRILEDIRNYIPNVVYRAVDGKRGLHAKFLVVDGKYAAVFTFNLYYTHYVRNYDIGVVVRGSLVELLDKIFDYLWSRATQP